MEETRKRPVQRKSKSKSKTGKQRDTMPALRIEIDKYQLEQEWESHSSMYHAWALALAKAQAAYDRAKVNLDVVESELESEIRLDPDDFGVAKVTDKAISCAVTSHATRKQAADKLLRAKAHLGECQAAVNALEHRKRALTQLVELWTRDYYATSGIPKQSTSASKRGKRSRQSVPVKTSQLEQDDDDNDDWDD